MPGKKKNKKIRNQMFVKPTLYNCNELFRDLKVTKYSLKNYMFYSILKLLIQKNSPNPDL